MVTDEPNNQEPYLKDLNFKVSPEFHKAMKLAAAHKNMSMKDLLIDSFEIWLAHAVSGPVRRSIYKIYVGDD